MQGIDRKYEVRSVRYQAELKAIEQREVQERRAQLVGHSAVRTWNKARTKATVTVTCEDGHAKQLGGQRAEKCAYALVYQRADGRWSVLGLRSAPKLDGTFHLGRQDIVTITEEV